MPTVVLPPPRLNEIKVNPPSAADNPWEYVELEGAPEQTMSRLFLVVLEGDSTATSGGVGRADMVVNLAGAALGPSGLLVIKSPTGGHTIPAGTAVIADAQLDTAGGGLENGSTSFLLVASLNPVLEGTDYDVDNDGALELPAGAVIVDAVGWTDGEPTDVVYGGVSLRQADTGAAHGASRFSGDHAPRSDAAWYSGALAGASPDSLAYDTARASGNFPVGGALTPGDRNSPPSVEPPVVINSANGYVIIARANDEDGTYRSNGLAVTVDDVAPSLAIGGAASVDEGSPYALGLSATDPGDDAVTSWTIDWGDGTGPQLVDGDPSSVTHVYADGPGAYVITATATNEDGTYDANAHAVAVNNVAPQVALGGDATGVRGQARAFQGSFSDAGTNDVLSAVVNYGDGTGDHSLALDPNGTFGFDRAYASSGTYTVTVTVADDDGGSTRVARTVSVTAVDATQADPDDPSRTMLAVGGTSGGDLIQVTGTVLGVAVTINGEALGVFNPTGRVLVFGQGGDDTVIVDAALNRTAELYGGAGNDRLTGGGGTNLLLGGDGNDTLGGGAGRDAVIGGAGADSLAGLGGDDLLVAGATAYDANPAALRAIAREWAGPDAYAQRVSRIASGAFYDGTVRLSAGTVFDDAATDTLTGALGDDWFFLGVGDLAPDRMQTETATAV